METICGCCIFICLPGSYRTKTLGWRSVVCTWDRQCFHLCSMRPSLWWIFVLGQPLHSSGHHPIMRAAHTFHAMQTCICPGMPCGHVVTSLRFALMALWDTQMVLDECRLGADVPQSRSSWLLLNVVSETCGRHFLFHNWNPACLTVLVPVWSAIGRMKSESTLLHCCQVA